MTVKTTLILERFSVNRIQAQDQLKGVGATLKGRAKVGGVKAKIGVVPEPTRIIQDDGERWKYTGKIQLYKTNYRNEEAANKYLEVAERFIRKAAETRGWRVVGNAADVRDKEAATEARPPFVLPDLTDSNLKEELKGVYSRDSHIKVIHLGMKTAVATRFKKRSHVLLWGQPAAAKTVLYLKLKELYERNDGVERVSMLDATTVSKAGLENWLLDKAKCGTLPEVLCLEEIEKYNPDNLLCLLSIMDSRGQIQRTNARIGNVVAKTPVVIWATCNDEVILKGFHKGALWSRFTKRLKCVRPNRQVMIEIMLDKIRDWRKEGLVMKDECAKVAVDYAFDTLKTNDPREIEGLLDGGDLLLDGTYFKYLEDIAQQERDDAQQWLTSEE